MGEIYRARDTQLGPDVAIKVLPDAFARDAERRRHPTARQDRCNMRALELTHGTQRLSAVERQDRRTPGIA